MILRCVNREDYRLIQNSRGPAVGLHALLLHWEYTAHPRATGGFSFFFQMVSASTSPGRGSDPAQRGNADTLLGLGGKTEAGSGPLTALGGLPSSPFPTLPLEEAGGACADPRPAHTAAWLTAQTLSS